MRRVGPGTSIATLTSFVMMVVCVASTGCLSPRKSRQKKPFDYGSYRWPETQKRIVPGGGPEEEAPPPPPALHGYVHAKARFVWIRRSPTQDSGWHGYITLGQSLPIRHDPRGIVPGGGTTCKEWVPVEPEGWVCVGRDATTDGEDPVFQLLHEHTANVSSAWPFDYAKSLGAPRYRTLPNARDQKAKEGDVTKLLNRIGQARSAKGDSEVEGIDRRLVGAELAMTGEESLPTPFEPSHGIMETDENIPVGSTIAYTYEFDRDGRAWMLGWDQAIIPQVRVKKFPRSHFRGVEIGGDVELPLAFVKRQGAYKIRVGTSGAPSVTTETYEPGQVLKLGQGFIEHEGRKLYAMKETGVYVSERDLVVVAPTAEIPKQVPATGRRTWIEVSTVGGWLVAFEGTKPIYATAITAGKAPLKPDGTMVPTSQTPTGTFTIKNKLKTATMRSDRHPNRIFSEVMYTQVFHQDYALHGAYWHDDFGNRRSAGCVNLSPIDSKWVFDWSEPAVPPGWHAKVVESDDVATVVVIHL